MANAPMGTKDRPWRARISFQNGEAANALVAGNAVALLTTNPAKVVSVQTAGAAVSGSLFAGIATKSAAVGENFDVVVAGYCAQVNIGLLTRANSSSPWPSFAAVSAGDYFIPDTVGGGMSKAGAGAGTTPYGYQVVAVASNAGATTTQASSIGGNATSSMVSIGCWIRGLM